MFGRLFSIFPFLALFMSLAVQAGPFAETAEHPYPEQLTSFEFSVDSQPPVSVTPTDTGTGYRGYYDVIGLAGTGNHTITVSACNLFGCQPTASPPFLFSTDVPGITSVSRLVLVVPP